MSSADVNRSPVEVCELHRLIDGLFACSSFAKQVRNAFRPLTELSEKLTARAMYRSKMAWKMINTVTLAYCNRLELD